MSKLPDIEKNLAEWYQEIVYLADLADLAPVKGCMVIRPYGYAIWENIQQILDKKIKDTGHQNAAFPLLIPKSFLEKEAKHVEGFSPELAVVTHAGGKELEEPLVVRPTSETVIHYMFAKWLKSWRDLPIKINQWGSVVRWEMRTRPFLRTTEFWWQEGHTAHETAQEAEDEARMMFREYIDLIENYLAIPTIPGDKTDSEKFAGADLTLTVEAMMPDGKALQMLTSHLISQNFAKSFNMVYQNREGVLVHPYLTSWGASTRLIGALIMVHGDNKGLVLPPKIAPVQVVIIPILKGDSKDVVLEAAKEIKDMLGKNCRVKIDDDETETPGAKFYKWELKGVPLRIEIGPKDIEKKQVVIVDRLGNPKEFCPIDKLQETVLTRLELMHKMLFDKAKNRLENMWFKKEKLSDFAKALEEVGGAYQTGWCGSPECEKKLKDHKATIRCILKTNEFKTCFVCDQKSKSDILVAKSY